MRYDSFCLFGITGHASGFDFSAAPDTIHFSMKHMQKPCSRLALLALLCAPPVVTQAAVWYDAEASRGDPLVTLSRLGVGYEYARVDSSKEKIIPGATWAFGQQTGGNDWAIGIETPLLINNADDAPSEEGIGDLKLRLSHTWLENNDWLVGSWLETEFDTAANDVQAIANQRTQMAFGGGFIRNLGKGWAWGASLQYGWSTNPGADNGWKSEWEFHLGIRKKLCDSFSAQVIYKAILNVSSDNNHSASVEPSLTWAFGPDRRTSLYVACEIPIEDKTEDYTAKAGLIWQF
jgi:hypothetical protein